MKAIILCGGEGTRLRPYTYTTPKPMLQIGNKPIVQYVIENLEKNGINEFVLTVGYLKEKIMEYLDAEKKSGTYIRYAVEDEPKKTAGSILPEKCSTKETFLVVMGDTINDINMKDMVKQHKKSRTIATICVVRHKTIIEYGTVKFGNGLIEEFIEKPAIENYINAGVYVFEPEIFEYIKNGEDFAKDVFPRLLNTGKKIGVYIHNGKWQDIGRVSDYERLKEEMEK